MRGDNGAAVWWLAPHRPAGPGGKRRGVRRGGRTGGGKGECRRVKARREENRGDRWIEKEDRRGGTEGGGERGERRRGAKGEKRDF